MGMSPGKSSVKFAQTANRETQKRRLLESQPEYKRRRLELKCANSAQYAVEEILEGDTYVTGIGLQTGKPPHNQFCSQAIISQKVVLRRVWTASRLVSGDENFNL